MSKHAPILDDRFILRPEAITEPVDFAAVFGSDRPVEIEIGSGRGTLLVHLAENNPDVNFLGIEWASEFYRYSADRLRRRNLVNARMMRTDARDFVARYVRPETVRAFHIYFPDPWPKKRHHKRRLFVPEFCQAAARALVPGGKIYIASDHQEYFQMIETGILVVPEFSPTEFDSPAGNDVLTNYEVKFVREGRSIYRLAAKKR